MNYRTLLALAVVGLLLVSSLDAAKAKGKKGGKGKKDAAVEKKIIEKKFVEKRAAKEEKPVKEEKPKVEKAPEPKAAPAEEEEQVVVVEEAVVAGEAPTPKIVRPKNLKVISAYDKCKIDCQKIREQQDLHSYAAQLRSELEAAEAVLLAAAEEAPAEAA